MRIAVVSAALALTILGGTASLARAGDPRTQRLARQHFKQGESFFAAGKFAEALAEYQAGYDAEPLPGFLVNIAQCHRRRGDLGLARTTYEKFVMVAPDSPLVPEVRRLIAEVDKLLADSAAASTRAADDTGENHAPAQPPAAVGDEIAPLGSIDQGSEAGRGTGPASAAAKAEAQASSAPPLLASRDDRRPSSPSTSPSWASRHKAWLWGGAAAVLVGGAATTFLLLRSPAPNQIHDGTLGSLRR